MTIKNSAVNVASFWMGERLSFLEQLCLKSFVDLGHPISLYSYSEIVNLPEGVTAIDARKILSEAEFLEFKDKPKPAPAVFADKFRVHLMLKTDSIWVDCDIYALKPFENLDYILPREFPFQLSNAVLRMPSDSPMLVEYAEFLKTPFPGFPENWTNQPHVLDEVKSVQSSHIEVHILDLKYYHWGPFALTYFARKHGKFSSSLPPEIFFPIAGFKTQQVLRPFQRMEHKPHETSWAIHLYSSLLKTKLKRRLVDGELPPHSFLKSLCDKHEINYHENPVI